MCANKLRLSDLSATHVVGLTTQAHNIQDYS